MAISHPFAQLLLRYCNHFATNTSVVVFPHAVKVGVVQVALDCPFIIFHAGITCLHRVQYSGWPPENDSCDFKGKGIYHLELYMFGVHGRT